MAKTTAPETPVADRMRRAVVELYAVEPGEFVERRTALVKQARADKDREAAKEIAALRKPSTSAWAVNQVVREGREVVEELRSLGARLRHAQSTLDGTALAGLRGERDAVLRRLAAAAATAAEQHGQTLSEAVQAEIRDTAVAALADAAAEEVAWSGSLTRALQYSGFGEVDVSDAVARTSTGVLLARIEGGAGRTEEDLEEDEEPAEEDEEPAEEDEEEDEDEEPTEEPAEVPEPRTAVDHGDLEEARLTLEVSEHELSARTAQLRLVSTRAGSTARRREQVETEVAQLEQEAAELAARLEEVGKRLEVRSGDLERCRTEDEEAAAKVTALEEAVTAATEERDEARRRVVELGGEEG